MTRVAAKFFSCTAVLDAMQSQTMMLGSSVMRATRSLAVAVLRWERGRMIGRMCRQEQLRIIGKMILQAVHRRLEVPTGPRFGSTGERQSRFALGLCQTHHGVELEATVFQVLDRGMPWQIVFTGTGNFALSLSKRHRMDRSNNRR